MMTFVIRDMNLKELRFQIQHNFSFTYAVIIFCTLMFIATALAGINNNKVLLDFGANNGALVRIGEYYRLVTSMFLHANPIHLIFNMIALYQLGKFIEDKYGGLKFLGIFILSGIGGSLLSAAINPNVISIGASGAIFGLIGAMLGNAIRKNTYSQELGIDRRSLSIFAISYLVLGFVIPGIDNWAHIGGFVVGIVLGIFFEPLNSFHPSKIKVKLEKILCIFALLLFFLSYIVLVYESFFT